MTKVDHPRAAAFSASGPCPPNLPHAASFRNHVPFFGIPRDELNECLPPRVVPDILDLALKRGVSATVTNRRVTLAIYAIGV
jgi:hypothetical protein